MINYTLNKEQAENLFNTEAILFGKRNGIPEYRIVELFGEWAGSFIERNIGYNGYLTGGDDYNGWGDCGPDRPMLHHLYLPGFFKVVSEHNYRLTLGGHRASEAGRFVDSLWKRREEALEAAEAEEERKRAERREKRAAARAAKQTATEEHLRNATK